MLFMIPEINTHHPAPVQGHLALVYAIEDALAAENGYVSEQDVLFELLYWLDNNKDSVLREIYAQALEYVTDSEYEPYELLIPAY